ncbi:hypothetical protein AVEN_58982-1 [Araneus ventricosus]|uniref:Uncharacterized protein n=1 Tax=Araneus ventricosus TaxID=182803 RepID=A0A4Y2QM05_ARAVE|nr:hypothetical protein AVEN_58982-1 [Araneus ventricosus]
MLRAPKAIPVDQHTSVIKRSPYIVSPAGRHMELSSTFKRIFSPIRDIKKIPFALRSHISSPICCQDVRQTETVLIIHTYPCKALFHP